MDQRVVADAALVGRGDEMAIIERRLTAFRSGHGALVLITGEPGIGKSTLALACAGRGRALGAAVAIGRCYEGGGQPPFAPWGDLFADLSSAIAVQTGALPPPFGEGPEALSAHQLLHAIARHLHAAAGTHPMVLVLEDVHWADGDALDLLDVVTRDLARSPVVVVVTYRPEAVHRSHPFYDVLPRLQRDRPTEILRLGELSVDETIRLVEERYGACSRELASYLHLRTDGQPLFIVELARDLSERRLLPRDADGKLLPPVQNVQVSGLLHHLISHRISRLGADVEALLVVAAVLGEEWDLATVEAVLGWDEEPLLRALDGALAAEVVAADAGQSERYRFRHALIRDVLYGEQIARRRKHLHLRVGSVLEAASAEVRTVNHAAIAYHFAEAERWEQAARYGIAAGDAARARYAGHGAVLAYQQALAALERAASGGGRELMSELLGRLGKSLLTLGEKEEAESAFQRLLDIARRDGDRASEARALSWISYVQRRSYDMSASRGTAESALAAAEEVGDPRLLALAHWNLGALHETVGNLDQSTVHCTDAERMARETGERDVLSRSLLILAHVAIWRGRYHDGRRFAEEALAVARTSRDALAVASAHWRLGIALGDMGHYDAALREVMAGISLAEWAGERYYQGKLLNTAGWLCLELGDPEEAITWDRRALETVRASHPGRVSEAERYALLNLVADELAAGRVAAAKETLGVYDAVHDQIEYGRFRYLNRSQLVRADVALADGDVETAIRFAQAAADAAADQDMPKNLAKAQLLRGRALLAGGKSREAAETLAEGVVIADRIEHGSLRWQSRLWLGRAHEALRRDASGLYREAWELISSLAGDLAEERRRSTFLASSLVQQVRVAAEVPGAVSLPAGLTSRELDVLRLVARHLTDKEIADELFVSHRTVQSHVTNILNKLGVANRREAAAMAAQLGLV